MANKKISQLGLAGGIQPGDLIPAARNGTNVAVSGTDLLALLAAQPTGLNFTASGAQPYRYWRISLNANGTYNTTRINDVKLTNGPANTDPMPPFIRYNVTPTYGENWPNEWLDNNPDTQERVFSYGQPNIILLDFSDPKSFDRIQIKCGTVADPDIGRVPDNILVEYSSDGVNFTNALNRVTNTQPPVSYIANQYNSFFLSVPNQVFRASYNLTADPIASKGQFLKVNASGTGFDYTDLSSNLATITGNISTLNTSLNGLKLRFDNRQDGLPYAYSGPKKYRYWRVGVKKSGDRYLNLNEIALRTTPTSTMPVAASVGTAWPLAWYDGDTQTTAQAETFGSYQFNDIDFGTPQLIRYITLLSQNSGAFAVHVSVSDDGVTYSRITGTEFNDGGNELSGNPNEQLNFILNLPNFVGQSSYNLTADPTKNLGKAMRVNDLGTGFDFVDLASGPVGPKGDTGATGATGPAGDGASLGFTPVQQGGGVGQMDNKVKIGWDGSSLRVTVDNTDLGAVNFGTSTGGGGGGSSTTAVRSARQATAHTATLAAGGPTTVISLALTTAAGTQRVLDFSDTSNVPPGSAGLGGYYSFARKVLRNGVDLNVPRFVSHWIDSDDVGAVSVTYSITLEYEHYSNQGVKDTSPGYQNSIDAYISVLEIKPSA